jgi:hypothetical protein
METACAQEMEVKTIHPAVQSGMSGLKVRRSFRAEILNIGAQLTVGPIGLAKPFLLPLWLHTNMGVANSSR